MKLLRFDRIFTIYYYFLNCDMTFLMR